MWSIVDKLDGSTWVSKPMLYGYQGWFGLVGWEWIELEWWQNRIRTWNAVT